jgi:dihydrofolate synthase/folylpolyglutamate synthase
METNYSEIDYLRLVQDIFHRFPSVQKEGFAAVAYKPGLDRMRDFDEALGFPSRRFRSIHIAGTNGKGSVANMLASACQSCGLKTALFTSPHLTDFRERMRVNSQLIPKEYVFQFLTRWMNWIITHDLSFFEITTGLAFRWFADEGVDVAVIETGLGGRLDATNILEQPSLTIVTSIGLDHCDLLGNTLEAIAGEKAGIFKQGVPALVGESQPETHSVFEEKTWMFCPLTYADKVKPSLWYRSEAMLRQMDLQGTVQVKNLRTALAAVDILRDLPGFEALRNGDAVQEGIIHTARDMHFHGRWERLSSQPFVIADIGHNAQALQYNFQQMRKLLDEGVCSSLIIVYGIMADKDLDAILPLMPEDATYIFTAPNTPRALAADDLLSRFNAFHPVRTSRTYAFTSVQQAVQMAVSLSRTLSQQLSRSASAESPAPPLIYIGGSTYVVAEALPLFSGNDRAQ